MHNLDLINLVPFELDIASTPFHDATITIYKIEFTPAGKKTGFKFLDDKDFTIPYIIDEIPNSPNSH